MVVIGARQICGFIIFREMFFLDPCVDVLKKLCSTVVECDKTTYIIRPVIVTVDTVARPILRNTMQFNGAYGCDFCLNPGRLF